MRPDAAAFRELAAALPWLRQLRHERLQPPPSRLWRMLARYLYEYQYLAFSDVADKRAYFLRSTWFDTDFFTAGALSEERFDRLAVIVDRLCATHAVDESRFRSPHAP